MVVALAAEESAGLQALRLVAGSGHTVAAVLTGDGSAGPPNRGATVSGLARDLGVPVEPARRVADPAFADELRRRGVDVLLNVHSLHLVAPQVLAAPRIGAFNLHPGPLPEYAGLDVPSWAIYHGRTRHGVTLHWMAPGIDTGPVAFTAPVELSPTDTGLTASAKCVQAGLPLVAELLRALAGGRPVPAVAQDLSRRRYHSREAPHGGWVPWSLPARQVVDFVRACDYTPWPSPWGLARTAVAGADGPGSQIEIVRAAPTGRPTSERPGTVGRHEDGATVAAGDEWVLVRRARLAGRSTSPAEVLRPGDRLVLPPSDQALARTPDRPTHRVR